MCGTSNVGGWNIPDHLIEIDTFIFVLFLWLNPKDEKLKHH